MLWCKETFEQHFDQKECRLFALQQQLFAFVDEAAAATAGRDAWLCFSIEFPSASDVSRLLSRHTSSTQSGLKLFQSRRDGIASPTNAKAPQKRPREDFSLLYGDAPLSQQTRMFLAATLAGVQAILATIEDRQLHLYEIIREGTPCHLYFDVEREGDYVALHSAIEVDDSSNSSSSSSSVAVVDENTFVCVDDSAAAAAASVRCGEVTFRCATSRYRELVRRAAPAAPHGVCGLDCPIVPDNTRTSDVLLSALDAFVRERYPSLVRPFHATERRSGALCFEEVWVLQSVPLSGAATKFSQHYVVKFHDTVFDSTNSVKAFVRQFVTHASERAAQERCIHGSLFFHGSPVWCPVFATLADDYPRNTLPYLPRRCIVDEAVYSKNRMMRCLGSCKLGKTSVLRVLEHHIQGRQDAAVDAAGAAAPPLDVFVATLIVPRPGTAASRRRFHVEGEGDCVTTRSCGGGTHAHLSTSATRPATALWTEMDEVSGADLEALAAALQRTYGAIAHTDCVVWRPRKLQDRFLTFQVRGTRYCQRVGREHKSNNVYLVVDLDKRTFVQKCFDPDCAAYRSPPFPVDEGA